METLARMDQLYRRSVTATIRARREMSGATMKQMAEACGVSLSTVKAWQYRDQLPHHAHMKKLDSLFEMLS